MDKYEYKIKEDDIKELIKMQEFAEAAEVADTIDWRRVKSVKMLCMVSDVYKKNRRYEDSRDLLLLAYDRHPGGRTIVYSLCELAIKMGDLGQALEYCKEFIQIAPKDPGRYILQYKLYEAQEVGLEECITVLEELKKRDYREKWAYELALLYHKVGMETKCVEECDELIVWFGEGKYVIKAMELKMQHQPLTLQQQEKYDNRFKKPEPVQEIVAVEEVPTMLDAAETIRIPSDEIDIQVKTLGLSQCDTINLQAEVAAGLKEYLEQNETPDGGGINFESADTSEFEIGLMQTSKVVIPDEAYQTEEQESLETGNAEEIVEESEISNAAEELPEDAIEEVTGFEEAAEETDNLEENTPASAEALEEPIADEPVTGVQKPEELDWQAQEMAKVLSVEGDGQISFVVPESVALEKQITGQMNFNDILLEWERMKLELEEKRKENVRQMVLKNTGSMFTDFEASVRDGLLEQLENGRSMEEILPQAEKLEWKEEDEQDISGFEALPQGEQVPEAEEIGEAVDEFEELEEITEAAPETEDAEDVSESEDTMEELEELSEEIEESSGLKVTDDTEEAEISAEMETEEIFEEAVMESVDTAGAEATEEPVEEENIESTVERSEESMEIAEPADEIAEIVERAEEPEAVEETTDETIEAEALEEMEIAETAEEAEEPSVDGEVDALEETEDDGEAEVPKESEDEETEALKGSEDGEADAPEEIEEQAEEAVDVVEEFEEPADDDIDIPEADREPVVEENSSVRKLSKEERELFAPYIQGRDSREQLVNVLDTVSLAAYTGNIVITGREGLDTIGLARSIIRNIQQVDKNFSGKVAKISGNSLNKRNISEIVEGLINGALIVQRAGDINEAAAKSLYKVLQQETRGIIVVLEGTKRAINGFFEKYSILEPCFNARIDMEALSNEALVAFAQKYAKEQECSIDEFGMLALHRTIADRQTSDHAVTIMEVKEIMDGAIESANRKSIGHFFSILAAKRYDDEDMIIIREKDFV